MKFAELPPTDRWPIFDREWPRMVEAAVKAAAIDPSDEISVAELGERHGIGERAMVARLREHGGMPYQLGPRWFIRRKNYALVLASLEATCNPT